MNKYAVAYLNYYDNEIHMISVTAGNEVEAVILGVTTFINAEDLDSSWLSELENMTLEDIKQYFWNGDQNVGVIKIE